MALTMIEDNNESKLCISYENSENKRAEGLKDPFWEQFTQSLAHNTSLTS
jgi:hypothetical protein